MSIVLWWDKLFSFTYSPPSLFSVSTTGSAIKPPTAVTAVIWCAVAEDTTLTPREWWNGATANIIGAATSRARSARGLWRDTYANELACSHHRQPRQSPSHHLVPIINQSNLNQTWNTAGYNWSFNKTAEFSDLHWPQITKALCYQQGLHLCYAFPACILLRRNDLFLVLWTFIEKQWNFSVHKSTWFGRKYPAVDHRPQENIVCLFFT